MLITRSARWGGMGSLIDFSTPHAAGLMFYTPFAAGSGAPIDGVSKVIGVMNNAPPWAAGGIGDKAIDFNSGATTQLITLDNTRATNTKSISISCWFNARSGGGIGFGRLALFESGLRDVSPIFTLTFNGADQIRFAYGVTGGALNALCTTTGLAYGTWYNLIATYDEVTQASAIYINGRLNATGAVAGPGSALTSSMNVSFGNVSGLNRTFDGRITNVKMWNRPLSSVGAAYDFNNPYALIQKNTFRASLLPVASSVVSAGGMSNRIGISLS